MHDSKRLVAILGLGLLSLAAISALTMAPTVSARGAPDDTTTCLSVLHGSWDTATSTCTVTASVTVSSDVTFYSNIVVSAASGNVMLTVSGGTFTSRGTLTLETVTNSWANLVITGGATFVNRGAFYAFATPDSRPVGRVNIYAGGTFDNRGAFAVGLRYALLNEGTFDNRGTLSNSGGIIYNFQGTFYNYGTVTADGVLNINQGTFNNRGTLNIVGTFENHGAVYNCGTISGTITEEYGGSVSYSCTP